MSRRGLTVFAQLLGITILVFHLSLRFGGSASAQPMLHWDNAKANTGESTPRLVSGTVSLDPGIESVILPAILESQNALSAASTFAVTDVQQVGRWQFVSIIGLVGLDNSFDWNLERNGNWFGLVIVEQTRSGEWSAAVENTVRFSEIIRRIPDRFLSEQSKQDLDPITQTLRAATDTYVFPWEPGKSMQYGELGVHNNDFNGIVPGWKAVDFLSDGNTGAGHAPNSLKASAAGTISYKCSPAAGQVTTAVRINDLMYAHLNNSSSLYVGRSFSQGDELGNLKTGNFDENCGWADQGPNQFHVHWGFPNTGSFQASGWTLSFADGQWRKGGETKGVLSWITAEGSGGDCNPSSDQIALYVRAGFDNNGQCVKKDVGDYPNPGSIGLPNDSIHSIKVGSNVKARLCRDDNFGEPCSWFDSDNGDIGGSSVGYGTSSVHVERKPPPPGCDPSGNEVAVYRDTNYGGECAKRSAGNYTRWEDMGLSENDKMSSIKVGGNVYVFLCADNDYNGDCEWYDSHNGDLPDKLDDKVSSMRVVNKQYSCQPGSGEVALFADANFGGLCIKLGQGDYSKPVWIGLKNDSVSSIRVGSSVKAVVYENDGYGGRQDTFPSDDTNLADNTIGNDSVSSVKVQSRPVNPDPPTLNSPAHGATLARNANVTLSWNTSANAYDYYAELWGGPSGTLASGWTQSTNWSIGQIWGGTYYWHVLSGNGAGGMSDWSEERTFTVKYGAPTNLNAGTASSWQINLTWTPSADAPGNISGYRIYRDGSLIAEMGNSTTNFQNTGLDCETYYTYTVTAYNGASESDHSNQVTENTAACAPNFTPEIDPIDNADQDGSYVVKWTFGIAIFELQEHLNGGGWYTVFDSILSSQTYSGKDDGEYCYRVRAYTQGGSSPWSGTKCTIVDTSTALYSADIFWYAPGPGNDSLYLSNADGTFQSISQKIGGTYTPLAADFSGDGHPDVFWYAPGAASDFIHFSNGDGTFHSVARNIGGVYTALLGDFDGDGMADVFWYAPGTGRDYLHRSIGEGSFISTVQTVNGAYTPLVGDFNADGADDIFWYAPGTAADSLSLANGDGTFRSVAQKVNGTSYKPLVGDFNGDGADDIFWYGPGAYVSDSLFLSNADGTFRAVAQKINGASYKPLVGDFDGDGRADIFWYAPGLSGDSLFLANGDGTFRAVAQQINGSYTPLVGDFNGDGAADIFWYAPGTAGDSLYLANGDGTFRSLAQKINGAYTPLVGSFD